YNLVEMIKNFANLAHKEIMIVGDTIVFNSSETVLSEDETFLGDLVGKDDTAAEVMKKSLQVVNAIRVKDNDVVATAKLPILNPNEFDLWKMRIEQYFSMTDYFLWEVILNGDSPSPTRIVDGVVQIIAPTTAEQRIAKKNELKARGTLLMALLDKHQLKFNIHKDAKTLMEAIEKRSMKLKSRVHLLLAKTHKTLHLYILITLTALMSQSVLFLVFLLPVAIFSTLPNVNGLSDAVIYSFFASQSNSPQLDNEDLKQIDPDDLKEMDLKWQMAMLTMRARRFLKRTRRNLGSSSSSGSDNEVAPCSKACSKSYATLQTHYDNLTVKFRKSQGDVLSYKIELHIHEFDNSVPKNLENDRYTSGEGYHVVPPPYTGTFMPPKPFNDAPTASESVVNVFHVESSLNKPSKDMSKTYRPAAPIIEEWISDSKDETEIESVPKQKEPSFVPTSKHVTTPKESVKKVEHPKQAENLRTNNQKSRGHKQSWNRKACFVCRSLNPLIKDCDYYEKQMEQKHVWNNTMRVNHQNSVRITRPYSNRNIVPTTVLTRSRLVSLNVARPVSTAVPQSIMKSPRSVKHVVNKAHSPIRRPINHIPVTKNSNFNNKVTTVKVNKINVVQGTKGNAEKTSEN
nr:ribonuclease H-like domain-containing protein [Tanacetum cinerariifolium]